ncbi:MAG: GntR family transcriptional regulator [Eubacterium sp.]|nr:GntR family transcriptional regulator [Eubacterium sp.]
MEYQFDNEKPIYIQLVELIKKEIVSGRMKSGEKIPSVRELAVQAKVNPNTVQKALAELERFGLIYTERTNGKYVTENTDIIKNYRNELIGERVNSFLTDMINMGVGSEEIAEYLNQLKGDQNSEASRMQKFI